jgi:hypothetical protein
MVAVLGEVTRDTLTEVCAQVRAGAEGVNPGVVLVEEAGRVNVVCTEYVTIFVGTGLAEEDGGAAALCEDVGSKDV